MRVFAQLFKENGLQFRINTLLQFGNSWDLIGNIVLTNPGSSEPISSSTHVQDLETIQNLKSLYSTGNWDEFKPDTTMYLIEKIFNGYYVEKHIPINGVIQLFNIFNIKQQDLEKAILQQQKACSDYLYSTDCYKKFGNKPTYFGWGKAVMDNAVLRNIAAEIFSNTPSNLICNAKSFGENSYYHPIYVNRASNQDHFKWYKDEVLERFCKKVKLC